MAFVIISTDEVKFQIDEKYVQFINLLENWKSTVVDEESDSDSEEDSIITLKLSNGHSEECTILMDFLKMNFTKPLPVFEEPQEKNLNQAKRELETFDAENVGKELSDEDITKRTELLKKVTQYTKSREIELKYITDRKNQGPYYENVVDEEGYEIHKLPNGQIVGRSDPQYSTGKPIQDKTKVIPFYWERPDYRKVQYWWEIEELVTGEDMVKKQIGNDNYEFVKAAGWILNEDEINKVVTLEKEFETEMTKLRENEYWNEDKDGNKVSCKIKFEDTVTGKKFMNTDIYKQKILGMRKMEYLCDYIGCKPMEMLCSMCETLNISAINDKINDTYGMNIYMCMMCDLTDEELKELMKENKWVCENLA